MSSGDVSDIANQPLMPSRPEEFHGESLTGRVAGYLLALVLLIGSYYIGWSFAILPVWVFLISVYILMDNLRRR